MRSLRVRAMKKILLVMLLMASPALAQTPGAPKAKSTARAADACAPIGRTAKGELVYSMKCDSLPVPPPAQAEAREAPGRRRLRNRKCSAAAFSAGLTTGGQRASRPGSVETLPLAGMVLASANPGCNGYG